MDTAFEAALAILVAFAATTLTKLTALETVSICTDNTLSPCDNTDMEFDRLSSFEVLAAVSTESALLTILIALEAILAIDKAFAATAEAAFAMDIALLATLDITEILWESVDIELLRVSICTDSKLSSAILLTISADRALETTSAANTNIETALLTVLILVCRAFIAEVLLLTSLLTALLTILTAFETVFICTLRAASADVKSAIAALKVLDNASLSPVKYGNEFHAVTPSPNFTFGGLVSISSPVSPCARIGLVEVQLAAKSRLICILIAMV